MIIFNCCPALRASLMNDGMITSIKRKNEGPIISSCDFPYMTRTYLSSIYRYYVNDCNATFGGLVECFQGFLDETRKYYQADLQSVDFKAKAEEARVEINTWVEKQTQGGTQTHTCKFDVLHFH